MHPAPWEQRVWRMFPQTHSWELGWALPSMFLVQQLYRKSQRFGVQKLGRSASPVTTSSSHYG